MRTFAKILVLTAVMATASAMAGTLDLANNFNASNNPLASNLFSYGWGGTFTAMSSDVLNCIGTLSDCQSNGLGFPNNEAIIWNGTGATYTTGTVNLFPGYVDLGAEVDTPPILRFTAPTTTTYSLAGNFIGEDSVQHPVAAQILVNGGVVFSTTVSAFNTLYPFAQNIALDAGDHLDFIAYSPIGDCCFLSAGVGGTITFQDSGTTTPEPGTVLLSLGGLAGIMELKRRLLHKR